MIDTKPYEIMAKLNLTAEEESKVAKNFEIIEKSFLKFKDINTENIEPQITVLDLQNVMRDDIVVKTLPREILLRSAPEQQDGYFQVPKTLD